jgi:hypothetical protein
LESVTGSTIISIWRWHISFENRAQIGVLRGAPLARLAAISICGVTVLTGATVGGRVEIVSSQDPAVRKNADYSGVVVWLDPMPGAPPSVRLPNPGKAEMLQKGKHFLPHLLAISLGTVVNFPNYDPIFHNAFSNFDGEIFDVGLYPPGTTRAIEFKREGIVRVFCNIHPAMSAVIVVLKSPYFATSARNGEFSIANVAPGSYRLRVFHERATQQTLDALTRTVEVGRGNTDISKIDVSESGYLLLPHKNKYGKDYPASESGTYPGIKP